MISIKKFLNGSPEAVDDSYERAAQLLLQAIGLHAVQGSPSEYEKFRARIDEIQANLAAEVIPPAPPPDPLALTADAIKALQEYNQRASKFIRAQGVELQSMVGMLTQAMTQISAVSEASVTRLQDLQKQIERATQLEDIRSLKTRLGECLVAIKTERARQRAESTRVVAALDHGMRQVQAKEAEKQSTEESSGEAEAVPGLLGRTAAEKDLRDACEQGAPFYAGIFVVDRLAAITSRFGNALADQVLAFFAGHLMTGLTPQDRVYRWERGSFLALLNRPEPADFVRRQLAKLLSRRLDQTFEIESRSVAVPVASTWTILPLRESSHSQILRKIEVFTISATN